MNNQHRKNEISKAMAQMEIISIPNDENSSLSSYSKIPIAKLPLLGAGLSALPETLQTIFRSSELYRPVTPPGAKVKLEFDGAHYRAWTRGVDGRFASQVPLEKVGHTVPFDPVTLFVAIVLFEINKKLDDILKTQKAIYEFLQDDKRSQLKGNLIYLTEVLNNYKHNWGYSTYKKNMHIKVQDIKQHSEQNVNFYQTQIEKQKTKLGLLLVDQSVNKKLQTLKTTFEDYQLAVYLFGFSSFLEVLLLENFNADYLSAITDKISDYDFTYRTLYTTCYDQIEKKYHDSIQAKLLDGVANTSKTAGNIIAKIPVISNTQLDENLIDAHQKINQQKESKVDQHLKPFTSSKQAFVQPFVENIKEVNRLYNEPVEVLFDDTYLYIPS